MESNGIKTPKILDQDKKCVIIDYKIDDFYTQLVGGRTTAKLNPNKNLECRVILKLKEKQPPEKEFYAVFGCWKEYHYNDSKGNFQRIHKRDTYLLPNRHVFKFKYDALKNEYIIIFGNGNDDYQLQLCEEGIYICWFDLVESSNVFSKQITCDFVWPHTLNEKNILELSLPVEPDRFFIFNSKSYI